MRFLLLFGLIILNSSQGNFKIENDSVYWQKIFSSNLQVEDIEQLMIESGNFTNVIVINQSLTAEIVDLSVDYRDYQPILFSNSCVKNHLINAFVLIEVKEGKYRATIKNINLVQNYSDNEGLGLGRLKPFENEVLRNSTDEFKNGFIKNDIPRLEKLFNEITSFAKSSSDW